MDRVKIIGCAYREWAIDILTVVAQGDNVDMTIVTNPRDVTPEVVDALKPDIMLFYGWSWMVPKVILDKALCLCLHPSPLPKYRGGSPFQHQILLGEMASAVSIFRMTEEIDTGDLCAQVPFSLEGDLADIFDRVIQIGVDETFRVLLQWHDSTLMFRPQEGTMPAYSRRQPKQSEIRDIHAMPAEHAYNMIRALQDPYPNAYVVCADGEKLYLTGAHL